MKNVALWFTAYFTGEISGLLGFPAGLITTICGCILFFVLFEKWFREK